MENNGISIELAIIILLAGVTLIRVAWPILEGIVESMFELLKVVLIVGMIGLGIILFF